MSAYARELAAWVSRLTFEDIPADVVASTKRRILDVLGLALAGLDTPFGRATRAAAIALASSGPCQVIGAGDRVGLTEAALVNGALAQALEYDDTHNESIVHMSSPSVAAALAFAEAYPVDGRDLLTAVAISNEIACRAGSVASGQFHRRGLHPTGLFAPFGVTYGIGKLLGLTENTMASAAGMCGSFAAGLLECWVDGTQTKFVHSGWAAHSGIAAAMLAHAGVSGPARVFEGRFGFFASHLQDEHVRPDFDRLVGRLGTHWESRNSSFKPYPAAHVLHPYVDAALRLRNERRIDPTQVSRIEVPVAEFIVGIVCEPVSEKLTPASEAHCRVSLQHTIAEALYFGDLGRHAYEDRRRHHPVVQGLATRVSYYVDPDLPGPGRFKGAVHVTLEDGRVISEVQEYNRGSVENPMSDADLRAKFDDNAGARLSAVDRDRLAHAIQHAERLPEAKALIELTVGNKPA